MTKLQKEELINSAKQNNGLAKNENIHYFDNPGCIVDQNDQTLIHLEKVNDSDALLKVTKAVNEYYFYLVDENNASHRSEKFCQNFIEHFRAYRLYTNLPYTSLHTASTHNTDHQICVDNLLYSLVPLSNYINKFVQDNYSNMYLKLRQLSLGPFVPKPFGIFPMIAINFNTISDYHWDENDASNCLCCLVSLGDFQGGELYFPQLRTLVPLRPGQIVAFSSHFLLHSNFPLTRGIRHSIVYFVHNVCFNNNNLDNMEIMDINEAELIKDLYDNQGLNTKRVKLTEALTYQKNMANGCTDKREEIFITLYHAINGLVDQNDQTLIHLEKVNDSDALLKVTKAVNEYYFYLVDENNASHRSEKFCQNFIEHFRAYRLYTNLPYTSLHTASTHNTDHQICVDNLLYSLVPLSNYINKFVQDNYSNMYLKLRQLSLGPFVPKPFGIFPMIAINFNTISDYHWDENDASNCLCCLVSLGDFQGGELYFPQLRTLVPLRPGQIVAFSSHFLLHSNFPLTRGIRHSIVYFVHNVCFNNNNLDNMEIMDINEAELIKDLYDNQGLNTKRVKLTEALTYQKNMANGCTDKREEIFITLYHAINGLGAEVSIPNK
ncbi:hypothetical protein Glove_511g13 [Diversispora epigaea]|uniref:Fe2OG dioxygenase domain-containing protein n=1 Tax=Diversispora epigaea TaxID=1348612 RepID=A0A397GFJ1_9GLOM|nr:hypothetical protein Glove_511g13 [Diversispora epigaea]